MAITVEQARHRRLGYGITAGVTGLMLASSIGAEGAFAVVTGGLGLLAEGAASPEIVGWDALLGFLFVASLNRALHYNSLYHHLRSGKSADTHTYTPPVKHPTYGRRPSAN